MNDTPLTANAITRKSQSNLAFALQCLPKKRRADLVIFYAFCRIIDDIADDGNLSIPEKKKRFAHWKEGLVNGFPDTEQLESQVYQVRHKYNIPVTLFLELIEGCEMDLAPLRFQTWEELQQYTYKVACVVGLITLSLFGADPQRSRTYALKLGHALQLTNIIRDVGEDISNGGRIYLPLEDLKRFQYTEQDLKNKVYDSRFQNLMHFQYNRACSLYKEASEALPSEDEKALKAAKIMADIYSCLLEKISLEKYAVLNKRISVSKIKKLYFLTKGMLS